MSNELSAIIEASKTVYKENVAPKGYELYYTSGNFDREEYKKNKELKTNANKSSDTITVNDDKSPIPSDIINVRTEDNKVSNFMYNLMGNKSDIYVKSENIGDSSKKSYIYALRGSRVVEGTDQGVKLISGAAASIKNILSTHIPTKLNEYKEIINFVGKSAKNTIISAQKYQIRPFDLVSNLAYYLDNTSVSDFKNTIMCSAKSAMTFLYLSLGKIAKIPYEVTKDVGVIAKNILVDWVVNDIIFNVFLGATPSDIAAFNRFNTQYKKIKEENPDGFEIMLTGHSKGGHEASFIMMVVELARHYPRIGKFVGESNFEGVQGSIAINAPGFGIILGHLGRSFLELFSNKSDVIDNAHMANLSRISDVVSTRILPSVGAVGMIPNPDKGLKHGVDSLVTAGQSLIGLKNLTINEKNIKHLDDTFINELMTVSLKAQQLINEYKTKVTDNYEKLPKYTEGEKAGKIKDYAELSQQEKLIYDEIQNYIKNPKIPDSKIDGFSSGARMDMWMRHYEKLNDVERGALDYRHIRFAHKINSMLLHGYSIEEVEKYTSNFVQKMLDLNSGISLSREEFFGINLATPRSKNVSDLFNNIENMATGAKERLQKMRDGLVDGSYAVSQIRRP